MALNISRAKLMTGGVLAALLTSGITSADEAKAPTTAVVKLTVID